jgi:hypothetical protein
MMSGFMGQVLVGMNSFGSALLAAEGDATAGGFSLVAQNAIAAIIFSVIGLVVLAISIVLMTRSSSSWLRSLTHRMPGKRATKGRPRYRKRLIPNDHY